MDSIKKRKLYIVGLGPGDEKLRTQAARDIIGQADRTLSTVKLSKDSDSVQRYKLPGLVSELEKSLDGTTVVLVSGDSSFFSVGKRLAKQFEGRYEISLISGISSIQYFSSKIAASYDDAKIVSMHGRDGKIVPKVCYNKSVFALTGGKYKAHDICRLLTDCGLGYVRVCIGEKLSYEDERIVSGSASELKEQSFDDMSVMHIENDLAQNPNTALRDEDFIRGESPMTKEEVRWLSIQKLGILPGDTVYDIGAGTGSVAVEMARKAYDGSVYAVEAKEETCALIEENRRKHGAYNISVIHAKAPSGILELAMPDKAFIGGSGGNMLHVVECLIAKNPNIRIVANAVTLQSLNQILDSFEKCGCKHVDTICVNIAKARKIRGYDMMTAQNPVYIITGDFGV